MTGLNDTDIRLDNNWQLTQATNGDAPVCAGLDCLYQNIALEAVTQKGDLFYDPDFGWSLFDFIQSFDDELTRLEIEQRARRGLLKREVILPDTIGVDINHDGDSFILNCSFRFTNEEEPRQLNVIIDAITVEVEEND